ncbi:MAG: ECF-type sigma factor [Planctomycetota bacterium]|jgi:RNA polymerase sigma factor (TIGR02999 family)
MDRTQLTSLLNRAAAGDGAAANEVWTLVYRDIRAMAASAVAGATRRDEFEPSVVAQEVYLRVAHGATRRWESRRHFFGAVARAMEQFLIDTARRYAAQKRDASFVEASVAGLAEAVGSAPARTGDEALRLFAHLAALEVVSPGAAEVLRLRYVFGLSGAQTAAALEIDESEVAALARFGRAFILDRTKAEHAERRSR